MRPEFRSALRHSVDLFVRPVVRGTVLTEFPKSGGTWIGHMLSAAIDVPYVRDMPPPLRRYLIHKHCLPGLLAGKSPVVVFRDGRDIMVSFYFHASRLADHRTRRLTDDFSSAFPDFTGDSRVDMPMFLERMLTRPIYPRFTWQEFVEAWQTKLDGNVASYEEAQASPVSMLQRLAQNVGIHTQQEALEGIVKKFAFDKQSGNRLVGEENVAAFLRKGIVGDWRNHFTREAADIFAYHAGDALIECGYEKSHDWVSRVQ